jgi:hypothetical protein
MSALEEIATADEKTLEKANVSPRVVSDAKVALELLKSGK